MSAESVHRQFTLLRVPPGAVARPTHVLLPCIAPRELSKSQDQAGYFQIHIQRPVVFWVKLQIGMRPKGELRREGPSLSPWGLLKCCPNVRPARFRFCMNGTGDRSNVLHTLFMNPVSGILPPSIPLSLPCAASLLLPQCLLINILLLVTVWEHLSSHFRGLSLRAESTRQILSCTS